MYQLWPLAYAPPSEDYFGDIRASGDAVYFDYNRPSGDEADVDYYRPLSMRATSIIFATLPLRTAVAPNAPPTRRRPPGDYVLPGSCVSPLCVIRL